MTRYDTDTVAGWLRHMQAALARHVADDAEIGFIGIRTGGVHVARALHTALDVAVPLGELNIAFYRDDFSTIGLHPVVGPSQVPFTVEGRHIVLIDDVLSTGRTIRAAMNEIFDYGRPARITLAVLVQRSGQELPIRADIVGTELDLPASQHVRLHVDDLSVSIGQRER